MGGEAYEDLGYGGTMEDRPVYKIHKVIIPEELIKIEYIKGIAVGDIKRIRQEIADDLIRRGYARRVD